MKNRELLKTGRKPAPGELALVQGFVNTLNIEQELDELDSPAALKSWLVRHGLLSSAATVGREDLEEWIAFREALRALLKKNGGEEFERGVIRQLNKLTGGLSLKIGFDSEGVIRLQPVAARDPVRALGRMLLIVLDSIADGSWWRLKACSESNCLWAFYDSSKNRSARWCSMAVCGSREKARTYRKRRAEYS